MQHLCWRQFILMKPGKSEGKKKGKDVGIYILEIWPLCAIVTDVSWKSLYIIYMWHLGLLVTMLKQVRF